jgi:hypothetical protein
VATARTFLWSWEKNSLLPVDSSDFSKVLAHKENTHTAPPCPLLHFGCRRGHGLHAGNIVSQKPSLTGFLSFKTSSAA